MDPNPQRQNTTPPSVDDPAASGSDTVTQQETESPVSQPIAQPPVDSTPTVPVDEPTPAEPPQAILPTPPKSNKKGVIFMLAALLIFFGAAGGGYLYMSNKPKPVSQTTPHIKVGVMMAFSGGSSSMGYGAMKGIQLAKKQLNADNIEIVQVDSKCDAKTAAGAIKDLISQHVAAIIGEGCSSASVAALPAANNSKTVMISPSASSPTLSIPDDYFFRVVPPDTFQGTFMAQHIYDSGSRNVAVIYTNEPYGSGMNQVFREKFEALGGKVVTTVSAEPDVIDLDSQIKTLKAANPQAIFIAPNSVVSATAIIKLSRAAGIKAPLFGADIMYDNTIIQNGGAAAEGLTISSFPTGTKSFKQSLQNEYQKTEQLYAAPQAYDIIHVLELATKQGATNGEQIKKALPGISFDGVSGHITFDQNGEISDKNYKYDLFQVKDGEFKPAE